MTKTTTNLLGIIITILAGTYFFTMYCSECALAEKLEDFSVIEQTDTAREAKILAEAPSAEMENENCNSEMTDIEVTQAGFELN